MSTFSDNDLRLLDKTLAIREKIVDNIITRKLPTEAKDIVSFTNLLESIDRSILGKAKIKIENSVARTNEETKEALRNMLLELHKDNSVSKPIANKEPPIFKSTGIKINEEETIIGADKVDIKEFFSD